MNLDESSRKKQGKSMKLTYKNNPNLAKENAKKISLLFWVGAENPSASSGWDECDP